MTERIEGTAADWPAAQPIAEDRLISGRPTATTLATASTATSESGLWRVDAGEFTTAHHGYVEFFHVIAGEGELVRDDGETTPLSPGTTITLEDGWTGRWVVREPLTKAYAIMRVTP